MISTKTRCPTCLSVYKVAMVQLTLAQGQVCCPKCEMSFNALSHLLPSHQMLSADTLDSHALDPVDQKQNPDDPLSIFSRKVPHSNIDLLTYLNNLNYFQYNSHLIGPKLGLNELVLPSKQISQAKKSIYSYVFWAITYLLLVLVLIYQVLWFSPSFVHQYQWLSQWFNQTCQIMRCVQPGLAEQPLLIEKLKLKRLNSNQTQFSGFLVNPNASSLKLPQLKLSLAANSAQSIKPLMILTPRMYLDKSLSGINRIPQNNPYRFQFVLNRPISQANQYRLEIVQP